MIYEVEQLFFAYPHAKRSVLNGVDLSLDRGENLTILGPNGAGKSTLLNCLVGLLCPNSGRILLDGRDITGLKEKDIAQRVSFVPQTHYPTFDFSVFEFVLMGTAASGSLFQQPRPEDREATAQVLEQLGLSHLAQNAYTEISGGERQLATIARAIVRQPQAIIFDEPTAHLDFGNQLRTLRVIKQLTHSGYSTIVTTHNPDHAVLLGGKTALLNTEGKLITGSVKEVIDEKKLSEAYHTDLRVKYDEELDRILCLYPNL